MSERKQVKSLPGSDRISARAFIRVTTTRRPEHARRLRSTLCELLEVRFTSLGEAGLSNLFFTSTHSLQRPGFLQHLL